MKISIISNKPAQKYCLQALDYKTINFQLDKEFDIETGWYELRVEYIDAKIEIQDIKINDTSIKEIIYTGYYTDGSGKIHQPATAVWDEGGVFSIWLHTELGVLFQRTRLWQKSIRGLFVDCRQTVINKRQLACRNC